MAMTSMDTFIQKMLLAGLEKQLTTLNDEQKLVLRSMIQEVYQNQRFYQLTVEQRVDVVIQQYRQYFKHQNTILHTAFT